MSDNKDIGKAYKESLQGHSVSPHNRVWENIEGQLSKPKRRILPFWLLFSAIALVVIPSSVYIYTNYYTTSAKTIELNETSIEPSIKLDKTDMSDDINTKISNGVDAIDTKHNETDIQTTADTNKKAVDTNTPTSKQSKVLTNTSVNSNKRGVSTTNTNSFKNSKNALKKNSTKITGNSFIKTAINNNKQASSSYSETQTTNTNLVSNTSNSISNSTISSVNNTPINLNPYPITELGMLTFKKNKLGFTTLKKAAKPDKKDKSNLFLKLYGGPLLFNSLKKGYSLDETLTNNPINTDVSYNYGAALVFELTNKSSISLGIGKTDLKYTVKQADSTNFEGNLVDSFSFLNIQPTITNTSSLGSFSSIDLKQELSYLEFPIYYNYSPIKNKFSLDIYGGPSFLALIDNRIIAISSNGNSLQIGEATNLGKFSVGLNIGVGVSYELSKKIHFGIEPTFKYYLNTFNNNSSFKPYSLGVNFGIRYKL